MEIWFVSQYGSAGTATLIKGPDGTVVLYDEGGGANAASKCKAILDAEGMSFIDYAIAGHYDSDHQGGLDDLVSMMGGTYSFGTFYDRGGTQTHTGSAIDANYYDLVSTSGKRATVTLYGSSDISLGYGAKVQFMSVGAPNTTDAIYIRGRPNVTTGISENNKSITALVSFNSTYGAPGFDLYLGSDAEGTTELAVDNVVGDLGRSCDVLLVDHHGSYTYGISSPEFLGNMDPELAIISVWDNSHGHPRVEVVENLQKVVEPLDQRIVRLMPGNEGAVGWAPETMDYCHTTGSDSIDGTVKITVSTDGLFYTVTGYGITEPGLTDHPVDEYFTTPTPTPAVDWNRSFEDWATETRPEKWEVVPESFARQTSLSLDGDYAAVLVGYGDSMCLTQALPADAPRSMEFGAWLQLLSGGGGTGGRVLYIYESASGGGEIYGNRVEGPTGWACSLLQVERGDDWTNEVISICFDDPAEGSEAVIVDAAWILDYSVPSPTPTPTPFDGWFSDWAWREKITIPAAGVESDLAGFPIFISLDSSRSQVFWAAQSEGADIVFSPGDRSSKWNHEIEKYNSQTGSEELVAWVGVPQLSSQTDTVFYMYYGNPSSAAQQDPAGVWDSHFQGVWHLGEGEGSAADDSTGAGNDGTASKGTGWIGEGRLDGAYACDGTADYFTVPDASGLKPTRITLEGWIKPAQIPFAVSFPGLFDSTYSYAYSFLGKDSDELSAYFHIDGSLKILTTSGANLSENTWYYAVARYDGSEIGIFINGEERASLPAAGNLDTGGGYDLLLGYGRGGVSYWMGGLDEMRLSDCARSDDWILTCYRNQSSPGDFFGISPREAELTPTVSPTASAPPTPSPPPSPTLTPVSEWNKSFEDWATETRHDKWEFVEGFARQTDNVRDGNHAAVIFGNDDRVSVIQSLPEDAPRFLEFGVWLQMLAAGGELNGRVIYGCRKGPESWGEIEGNLIVGPTGWAQSSLQIEREEGWTDEWIKISLCCPPMDSEAVIIDGAWIRDYSVPSPTPTPTPVPSATPSATPTVSVPPTPAPSPSATPTVSVPPTPSPPPSATPTPSASPTTSPTASPTPSLTPTPLPPPRNHWIYDYNGDGTSDVAIFRASSGLWAIRGISRAYFGSSNDLPVPGDFDGDGTTDIGIFRSASGLWAARGVTRTYFGGTDDEPIPGDYEGYGTVGIAIFRPASGLWAIKGVTRAYFGGSSDIPLPGYWAEDPMKSIGIFRPASGLWAIKGITRAYFGSSVDKPVPGDYAGTGSWTQAIFRETSGLWAVKGVTRAYFGGSTDSPIPGGYNGDGKDYPGIFRGTSGLWAIKGVTRTYFGSGSDIPVTR